MAETDGINRTMVVAGLQVGDPETMRKTNWRTVRRLIKHPEYVHKYSPADVGLIEIEPALELGERTNIYPICLSMKKFDLADYGLLLITGQSQSLYLPDSMEAKEIEEQKERNELSYAYVKQKKNGSTFCDSPLVCFSSNSTNICKCYTGRCPNRRIC